MEEQSCVLPENGRRISAFASQLPFMRGTALTPDPGIKNRQAPCGACRVMVRVVIQHFSKNTVISMVLGHPNSEITCIPPS